MKMFKPYNEQVQETERFAMLPMILLEGERYAGKLDMGAVVAYSILRNRQSLSLHNGWVDDDGNTYCYYAREDLAKKLSVSLRSVDKILNQLREAELIKSVRQGFNMPNRIYVGLPSSDSQEEGRANSAHPDKRILRTSYKESINTEKNNNATSLRELDGLVKIYADAYKFKFGKEHPRLTAAQLAEVEAVIGEMDWDEESSEWVVARHFNHLPLTNDGNINAFVRALKRYEMEWLS